MRLTKRGQIMWNKTIGWSIAIIVLVLILIGSFALKDKGIGMLNYFKSIFSGIK